MKMRPYVLASGVLFLVVGLVHLLRAVEGWPAMIGGWAVPLWISGLAFVLSEALACWGFLSLRKT